MEPDRILITGAAEHNLKGIDVSIPKRALVVLTGVSGSGKTSLAFDTLYAEGQRRYVESLSAYARQFLGQLDKPRYESIRGLAPTIAIEQRTAGRSPRSTVATITEVHDYLRVLYARVGTQHCPRCDREVERSSPQEVARELARLPAGTRFLLLAPLVEARKGEHREVLEEARGAGLVRVRVDGELWTLDGPIELDRRRKHHLEAVVDRLVAGDGGGTRLVDSVETALRLGKGHLIAHVEGEGDRRYSEELSCAPCGLGFPPLSPQRFSFNSPQGSCPECQGLGTRLEVDPDLLVPDPTLSIHQGAVRPWARRVERRAGWDYEFLLQLSRAFRIPLDTPWGRLSRRTRDLILHGSGGRTMPVRWEGRASVWESRTPWKGLIPRLREKFLKGRSERVKAAAAPYMAELPCAECRGERLREESRWVRVAGRRLPELERMAIAEAVAFFEGIALEGARAAIARELVREIRGRLGCLADLGLGYLSLDRRGETLSGGEAQRIRLASQIGSELTGVCYVLDEPSIGLHPRDNARLLSTLERLRDLGNTVVVVEHDRDAILRSDHVIDFGPGAGVRGGRVVFEGRPEALARSPDSLTGRYLRGELQVSPPREPRPGGPRRLVVRGAAEHNLRGMDVELPLGLLVCVSGVSGAGKSTLVNGVLLPALARHLGQAGERAGRHAGLAGVEHLDKVIAIDQRPIGRTPRSNPATYTKVYGPIREFYASLKESRVAGYGPGRFSFNVKGGRCEACEGDGLKRIEMHFLPDVYVTCEHCAGTRFNEATLRVRYRGLSIADVLGLTVAEALEVFRNLPDIARILETLVDVGVDYLPLGQPSTTLSGGEAQRIKLSRELARRATGRTLYALDEPSTGLHFDDTRKLLAVLHRLVDAGNTVVVIEHNLDVLLAADWVIDLGPEGGDEGGALVAAGPPQAIARSEASRTGAELRRRMAEDQRVLQFS